MLVLLSQNAQSDEKVILIAAVLMCGFFAWWRLRIQQVPSVVVAESADVVRDASLAMCCAVWTWNRDARIDCKETIKSLYWMQAQHNNTSRGMNCEEEKLEGRNIDVGCLSLRKVATYLLSTVLFRCKHCSNRSISSCTSKGKVQLISVDIILI